MAAALASLALPSSGPAVQPQCRLPFLGASGVSAPQPPAFSGLVPTGPLCEEITSVFLLTLGAPTSLRRGDGRRCGEGRQDVSPGLERRGSVGWGGDRAALGGGRTPPLKRVWLGRWTAMGQVWELVLGK